MTIGCKQSILSWCDNGDVASHFGETDVEDRCKQEITSSRLATDLDTFYLDDIHTCKINHDVNQSDNFQDTNELILTNRDSDTMSQTGNILTQK